MTSTLTAAYTGTGLMYKPLLVAVYPLANLLPLTSRHRCHSNAETRHYRHTAIAMSSYTPRDLAQVV
jgi:hypothetical protein